MKSLWRKNENKNKALLDYRATPIPGIGLSSSQLCMGRRLRTTLPVATGLLKPETYNAQEIKGSFQKAKDKYHYDRHGTRELPPLKPGDHVRVKPEHGSKEWKAATVVQSHASPRSYVIDTGSRRISRNRVALRADRPESHAGYQRRQVSTLQQSEPEQESDTPDTDTAPQPPSGETLMRNPVQVLGTVKNLQSLKGAQGKIQQLSPRDVRAEVQPHMKRAATDKSESQSN